MDLSNAPAKPASSLSAGIERICLVVSFIAIGLMFLVVALEVVLRAGFSKSLGISDELSAYFLVMLCFFSLSVTYARNGFHRVDFAMEMLPGRGFALSRIVGDIISMAFFAVLIWQFTRMEIQAYQLNSMAPTLLRTPQWIPMLSMVVGSSLLFISLALSVIRSIGAFLKAPRKV